MKNLFILILSLLFFSCNNKIEDKKTYSNDIVVDTLKKEIKSGEYSNPVLIQGSDFGSFFQAMYKIGDFEKMLKFTSSESIKEHGSIKIIEAYQSMDFGYKLKLKSKTNNPNGSITLNYNSDVFATNKITRINVIIENDSCKIILPKKIENLKL